MKAKNVQIKGSFLKILNSSVSLLGESSVLINLSKFEAIQSNFSFLNTFIKVEWSIVVVKQSNVTSDSRIFVNSSIITVENSVLFAGEFG